MHVMTNKRLLLPALLLGVSGFGESALAAEACDSCAGFINSLPATIDTPGTWCLRQDLDTAVSTGQAISIAADNVTLDCNHFAIDGSTAGLSTKTKGIMASGRNATVRRCQVRGFMTAC